MAFGKAKKVRFKQKGQFASLEGKTNKQGIRWTGNGVEWSKLKLSAIITNDSVLLHGLSSKIKYVRLVRRILNQKTYWFAQLVCEGEPYQKPRNIISDGTVGMEQSLLDGWQRRSNQSARTATSSKSLTGNSESEWMSSASIAREESEPARVNETRAASWNPPDLSVG